jgi:hypothetical protein
MLPVIMISCLKECDLFVPLLIFNIKLEFDLFLESMWLTMAEYFCIAFDWKLMFDCFKC